MKSYILEKYFVESESEEGFAYEEYETQEEAEKARTLLMRSLNEEIHGLRIVEVCKDETVRCCLV